MIKAPVELLPLRTGPVGLYPALAPLRASVRSGDWASVSAYFQGLPVGSDQSDAVWCVATTARSERFLQRTVDTERDSSLARTLFGARLIRMAWDARGSAMGQYVTAAQRQVFHRRPQRAERELADATAIDPSNAAAWTQRVVTARGLRMSTDEARRRYDRAAEHCAAPYTAQAETVQSLCPKWGGTMSKVHAFARDCLASSAPGSLGGAIVADAHMEHAFTRDYVPMATDYLRRREVREEIAAAAAHTVLHPDFRPHLGWVAARSAFAFALYHGGAEQQASPHFAALGARVSEYGWNVFYTRWKRGFRAARRETTR